MQTTAPHKIITFSGPDRCGKTTQLNLLNIVLEPSVKMKFPNESHWSGQIIRAILSAEEFHVSRNHGEGKWYHQRKDPYIFQYLNAINRQAFNATIWTTLRTKHILMDRYDVDLILYGVTEGLDLGLALEMLESDFESDLVIIPYGSGFGTPENCLDNNDRDRSLQAGVMKTAEAMASLYPDRYRLINVDEFIGHQSTTHSIWGIHKRICGIVGQFLGQTVPPLEYVRVEEEVRQMTKDTPPK